MIYQLFEGGRVITEEDIPEMIADLRNKTLERMGEEMRWVEPECQCVSVDIPGMDQSCDVCRASARRCYDPDYDYLDEMGE